MRGARGRRGRLPSGLRVTMSNEIIEHIANVIAADREECGNISGCPPEVCRCLRLGRAAIDAHIAALKEAGFVIVPREPTEPMIRAAIGEDRGSDYYYDHYSWFEAKWKAMIDAALA